MLTVKRAEKLVKCVQRQDCILLKLHYFQSYLSHYSIFFKCSSPLGAEPKLKIVSATFLLVSFLSVNESTYQARKSAFYFTSITLSVLEKIKF